MLTQPTEIKAPVTFYSCSSISKWADHSIQFLDGDKSLPYVEKDGMWFYFGKYDVDGRTEYRLICSSSTDLQEPKD